MSQIESENLSQIRNCEQNGCSCSQIKSENWVKLNQKLLVNFYVEVESNLKWWSQSEKWIISNLQNWVKSEKVSQILSETGNLLKILMQMAVWCLRANGAHSNLFVGISSKGVYVDVAYNETVFGQDFMYWVRKDRSFEENSFVAYCWVRSFVTTDIL